MRGLDIEQIWLNCIDFQDHCFRTKQGFYIFLKLDLTPQRAEGLKPSLLPPLVLENI